MSCAQSTNDDVRDLINGATSKEDDPQKIVQEIEKGLQKKIIAMKTILLRVQL